MPSYPEFVSRVSLDTSQKDAGDPSYQTASTKIENDDQAYSILDFADHALRVARKDWEAISKAKAETARCVGCEEWWRTSVKNVVRSCITANIMIATAKKAMSNATSKETRDILQVEVVKSDELYHTWWIVPRLLAK